MTATDELRRLLDERGVEYEAIVDATLWKGNDGTAYTAAEVYTRGNMKPSTKKLVIRHMATPAQAIAATLGAGTCHDDGDPNDFCCSECGMRMYTDTNDTYTMIASDGRTIIKHPNFCPNCGAKVVNK